MTASQQFKHPALHLMAIFINNNCRILKAIWKGQVWHRTEDQCSVHSVIWTLRLTGLFWQLWLPDCQIYWTSGFFNLTAGHVWMQTFKTNILDCLWTAQNSIWQLRSQNNSDTNRASVTVNRAPGLQICRFYMGCQIVLLWRLPPKFITWMTR